MSNLAFSIFGVDVTFPVFPIPSLATLERSSKLQSFDMVLLKLYMFGDLVWGGIEFF